MPIQARVLILSRDDEFHPVTGLESFPSNPARNAHRAGGATYVNTQKPTIEVKP